MNRISCSRILASAALALVLMLLTSATAWAADITLNTAVVINKGNKSTYHNKSIAGTVPSTSSAGNNGTFITKGAIVVDGIELNLTIDGFNADYTGQYTPYSGISLVNGAKLHLTVMGENTLTGGYGGAGIAVPFGCSLEITSASTGTLNATGGRSYGGGAGIGSRGNGHITQETSLHPQGCGDITINGGTINATGGTWYEHYTAAGGAAGIGSSEYSGSSSGDGTYYGDNTYINNITGNITINGGTVCATGGAGAAGIGGGTTGTVKTITINGGNVTATTAYTNHITGAAIGSGANTAISNSGGRLTCADISITGGTVRANGNIGYGDKFRIAINVGGSVTISDDAAVYCTGNISPSTQHFVRRTFRIAVYDASLTATANNVLVQLPLGKTAYCDLQVEEPGIGTATVDVLYRDGQLGGSGTLTVRGFTSDMLSLSESSQDVAVGGYCYNFSVTIYDKDIGLNTTATFTLDDVSFNGTYTPVKAGSGDTAGTARFSGYFISPSMLLDAKTFSVRDSHGNDYTKTVNMPATKNHKGDLSFLIYDGSRLMEVNYMDENQTEQACTEFQIVGNGTTWGTENETTWLVCFDELNFSERITVKGTVNLILWTSANIYAQKGISVLEGNSLSIYGQKDGAEGLTANCGNQNSYAGIGGYSIRENDQWIDIPCGSISIYGGVIKAIGGPNAAGIGGGPNTNGGTVRIYGGVVTATGGECGAGIGSGYNGNIGKHHGGTIEIHGGTVTATGQSGGAGIGGGARCDGHIINISGGMITTSSEKVYNETKKPGAGIGGGVSYNKRGGGGGTITIVGGKVSAPLIGSCWGVDPIAKVRLGWKNLRDAIFASYNGTVTLSSKFMLQGTGTKATPDNIKNKRIVPPCTISFDANGGSGSMNSVDMAVNALYELPKCTFTAPDAGMVFDCWQIGDATYGAGTRITMSGNLSAKALWREAYWTVTFDLNGHGAAFDADPVDYGTPVTAPYPAPTADGYVFAGWYLGETAYNFNAPVTDNITLTAHWSKVVSEPVLTVTGTYTYTGEQIVPTLTVKDGETVVPASEYTVTTQNTTKVGTATVTITDKAGGDYQLGTVSATFTVAPKAVTVSGITAKNKHYDENTDAELDGSHAVFSGIVEGDVLTVTATGTFASAEVGEGRTVNISDLTLGGRDADNYELAGEGQQTEATATIYAPHTVTFVSEDGNTALAASQTVLNGATATKPDVSPVKDGWRFMNEWMYGDEVFDFSTALDFETTTTVTLKPRFLKVHTIHIPNAVGTDGSVAASVSEAVCGEEITITATPSTGNRLVNFSVDYTENAATIYHPFTMTGENEATFVMPDADDVWVTATFTASDNLLAGLLNGETGQYEVTTAADLTLIGRWIAADHTMAGETILLKNDIDVSGSGFDGFSNDFNGTFDGGGKAISGINISRSGSAGVFTGVGGTVKNLTLVGSVTGGGRYEYVGGIAVVVRSGGRIQNCVSLMKVAGDYNSYTGGIAGQNAGIISGCYYLGGGVPGPVSSYEENAAATNCTPLYAIEGNSDEYDGIVTVGSKTTSEGNEVGGYFKAGSDVTLTLSAPGKDGYVLKGYKYQVYNESTYDYEDVNLTDNGNGTYMLSGISQDVTILTNYSYGGLSSLTQDEQNRYLVTSVADLNTVASVVGALDGCRDMTFLLANDIEFGEDDEFGGIAVGLTDEFGDELGFMGTFDGGGHSIIGMKIGGKAQNLGFIGYLTGTLQNLTLEYCTVKNTSDADDTYVGMLVGYCSSGYLANCRVFGGEVSGANAGAIYGDAYPYPIAEDNLYDVYVTVVSGGETKAPGTCGTGTFYGDINENNAAVVAWNVYFMDYNGQVAPAQLVPNGGIATKPEVSLEPREHFTFNDKWKRGGMEYTFNPVMTSDHITANTTLFPLWDEETKYTVTYDGNGSADNSVSESVYASDVSSYRLPYCFYEAPAGCYFNGWKVGEDIYNPDASITLSKDIIVKAQWGHYDFELENDADNADVLESWNTKVADVTLADRTLYKDGNWNTLCLPFDVTIADSPLAGDGVDVRTLSGASLDDGTLTLTFTEAGAVETLSAGVPYIIRWTGVDAAAYQANPSQYDLDASALTFPLRAIDETLNDQFFTLDETEGAEKRIAFRGTYAPITYDSENRSILFVGGNNTLYWPKPAHSDPNDENSPMLYPTIGAQRAYFELDGLKAGDTDDPDQQGDNIRAFVLNFGDEDTQGITAQPMFNGQSSMVNEGPWYSLDGVKLDKAPTRKGLYIHNGKKVVIK